MIQISDMNAFVAVVEMTSFTEAARRLGIAKSTLYAKMERYGLSRHGILSGG